MSLLETMMNCYRTENLVNLGLGEGCGTLTAMEALLEGASYPVSLYQYKETLGTSDRARFCESKSCLLSFDQLCWNARYMPNVGSRYVSTS